jgi:Tol biopolymer transport system component
MPLEPGQRLLHYRIVEKIGEGGMGQVWKATDTNLDRDVAIKVLPPALAEQPERLERFEQEARTTGALNHPNVVAIYDLGRHEDAPYIVMELVPGETLREKIAGTPVSDGGSTPSAFVPPRKALEYVTQIARGLAAAHERGVVHRDLQPENIIVTPSGQAKILDFGLAKLLQDGTGADSVTRTSAGGVTAPGSVMGTVGYMAPEQVRGKEVDHRADIFALGTILYELLAGKRAFQAESPVETMSAILTTEPPPLSGEHPQVPPVLDRIIQRCLEKEPGERFQSGHDLAFALQAIGEGTSTELRSIEAAGPKPSRRLVFGIVAVVAAAVLGFLGGRGLPRGGGDGTGSGVGAVRMAQLTFAGGVELQPTVSPDGRSIVYVAFEDGARLYYRRVGGETSIALTPDDARGWSPAFSPDGESVAYRSNGGIFVMGATGESMRRLTDFGFNPSWSPDGKSILVATEAILNPFGRGSRSQLWRIDVATGERTRLDQDGDDIVQPRSSPGGHRIAYWGLPVGTGRRVLYTMPAEGGDPIALTDDDAINWNPVWSPDGAFLYFLSDRGGIMNVWRRPIDERSGRPRGEPQRVTASTAPVTWLDVARDTGRLVFSTASKIDFLKRARLDPVRREITSEPEVLLESSLDLTNMVPSPDDRWVALTGKSPQEDLYLLDLESSRLSRLTDDVHKDRVGSWSADSERIYFFSTRSGNYQAWSMNPDGSALTQVTALTGQSVNNPNLSPDGRLLAVGSAVHVSLIDLTAGELPITEAEALPPINDELRFVGWAWSPDGRRLVGNSAGEGERGGRGVWIYEVDTGEYREIKSGGGGDGWFDDRTIASGTSSGIELLDIETGAVEIVTVESGRGGWEFSHDRRWVYYTRTETQGDVWMLDHE